MDLTKIKIRELTTSELITTEGWSESSDTFYYGIGVLAHGISVFVTEGGGVTQVSVYVKNNKKSSSQLLSNLII